jgi:hypothetical protein
MHTFKGVSCDGKQGLKRDIFHIARAIIRSVNDHFDLPESLIPLETQAQSTNPIFGIVIAKKGLEQ